MERCFVVSLAHCLGDAWVKLDFVFDFTEEESSVIMIISG